MIRKLELVQTAKIGISEIKKKASQIGYSVSYCMFDRKPIAIMHNGVMKDGEQCNLLQNFQSVDGEQRLCMGSGNIIRWSQFIFRGIKEDKNKEYNLYTVKGGYL